MIAPPTLILNVDDNDGARYAKTRILQVAGFDVIEAANGADALMLVRQRTPDLVLLDVKLPDINGLEVCRRIKSEPSSATVLVLQTSAALTGRADKVRGLEGGADNYLAAPIGADELVANVNALLRLRKIQFELRESEERFRQMAENISDVFWIFSLAERTMLYVSPAYGLMWGRDAAALSGDPAAWLEAVHAADLPRVRQHFDLLFEHQPYDEEYRIVLGDGTVRWVRDRGFPVRDANDTVYRVARITSDITAAKQAEKSLQEADVHKDEFLATLAHELRSPLGPIRNAVQVMQQAAPPQSREYAYAHDVISRQVDHMARLIDDLLDIARISRGKISLKKVIVDLDQLIASAVETSSPFINQRDHVLEIALPQRKIQVLGDPVRLAQVISNLLNNAAKYTMRGGNIALSVVADGGDVHITVRDNGIGISDERAKTIFDLFAQGDAAPDLAQDGLGVGLSLVKQLVSLHDGSVRLESPGPGHGSSFEVTLPIISTDAAAGLPEHASGEGKKHPDERVVLIVDDNADSADTTALLLNTYGHVAHTACDALSAITSARRYAPDVILLDIGLPGTDGYEVARMLRKEEAFGATRLIAITGYGADRDREKALAAGFDYHMVKPADIQQLLALITAP